MIIKKFSLYWFESFHYVLELNQKQEGMGIKFPN